MCTLVVRRYSGVVNCVRSSDTIYFEQVLCMINIVLSERYVCVIYVSNKIITNKVITNICGC